MYKSPQYKIGEYISMFIYGQISEYEFVTSIIIAKKDINVYIPNNPVDILYNPFIL